MSCGIAAVYVCMYLYMYVSVVCLVIDPLNINTTTSETNEYFDGYLVVTFSLYVSRMDWWID